MKHLNLGTVLLVVAAGLLVFAAYDYLANRPITPENCGVTVASKEALVSVPTGSSKVRLQLTNRSGRPIRIVGNNAC
jgi:hypothetical protein